MKAKIIKDNPFLKFWGLRNLIRMLFEIFFKSSFKSFEIPIYQLSYFSQTNYTYKFPFNVKFTYFGK